MSKPSRREESANRILSLLSADDLRLLEPHLSPVDLPLRLHLEGRNRRIEYVYFIESGFASVVANSKDQPDVEVGLIGCEGVTGIAVILGTDRSPHETYMQSAGAGQRMAVATFRRLITESPTLQRVLLNYAHTFLIQTSYTALANSRSNIQSRLARWLLMAHDRGANDQLTLTHEFLAIMLGVRRAGVTAALGILKKKALISTTRKIISVLDRNGLEKLAKSAYGAPEAEYKRLFG